MALIYVVYILTKLHWCHEFSFRWKQTWRGCNRFDPQSWLSERLHVLDMLEESIKI